MPPRDELTILDSSKKTVVVFCIGQKNVLCTTENWAEVQKLSLTTTLDSKETDLSTFTEWWMWNAATDMETSSATSRLAKWKLKVRNLPYKPSTRNAATITPYYSVIPQLTGTTPIVKFQRPIQWLRNPSGSGRWKTPYDRCPWLVRPLLRIH
jgi:hypothetical protein